MYVDTRKRELVRAMVVANDSSLIEHKSLADVAFPPLWGFMALLDFKDYRGISNGSTMSQFCEAFERVYRVKVPDKVRESVDSLQGISINFPKTFASTPEDIHHAYTIIKYLITFCEVNDFFTQKDLDDSRKMLKIQVAQRFNVE